MAYNTHLVGANSTLDATPQWRAATASRFIFPGLLGLLDGLPIDIFGSLCLQPALCARLHSRSSNPIAPRLAHGER
jgi:hypothetical protein